MDSEMQRYSRLGLGFYQTGYTLTVEDAKDDRILAVNICFRAISFVREKLGKLFIDFPPTSQMNGNNWNITGKNHKMVFKTKLKYLEFLQVSNI